MPLARGLLWRTKALARSAGDGRPPRAFQLSARCDFHFSCRTVRRPQTLRGPDAGSVCVILGQASLSYHVLCHSASKWSFLISSYSTCKLH
ncbi:2-(3-Amino-3-Carboxypropyl)Histidine Synthase Subunit 2 [Manis pentadactyla]|nr:2-(3-Amino-3-Carboxypropyl)Histidine Synthase Subunit 2 [Manis pentadactyla]